MWWGHAEDALLHLAETLRIPVFANRMARSIVGADRDLAFSRARAKALAQADVALVVGCRWTSDSASAACSAPRPGLSSPTGCGRTASTRGRSPPNSTAT